MDKNKQPETPKTDNAPAQVAYDEKAEASKWKKRFTASLEYQKPMFNRYAKWYGFMYAHFNNSGMSPWRSKVFMPVVASKVWDLIARFIQYRPSWDLSIRTLPNNLTDQKKFNDYMGTIDEKIEKVKAKLDYDYDNPALDDPIPDELAAVMMDATVTGQGVGRVPYIHKKEETKLHKNQDGKFDMGMEEVTASHSGHNGFQAVNIYNFFIEPSAVSLQKAAYIIVADFIPLHELQADGRYKNLEQITNTTKANDRAEYNYTRNLLVDVRDPYTTDTETKNVEVLECWEKESGTVTMYARSGSEFLEIWRSPNMYWHGKYPFVAFHVRKKAYQFWGESIFENSESLQVAINDVFNHFMDGLNMADGMIAIEEGSVVEPYIIEPGGELRYRGELPKQFKFPQPDPGVLNTVMNVINGAVENATISQYASGIPNSSTDSTQGTATGITRLMEAAAEKVGMMRSNFRRSWREVGYMWLSNTQQFMDDPVLTKRKNKGKVEHVMITPEDMMGVFNIRIDDGSFEPVSKDEQRKNFLEYTANLKAWQDSSVEQVERTQDQTKVVNIDWTQVALRGSELYGENNEHFVLPPSEASPVVQEAAEVPPTPEPSAGPAIPAAMGDVQVPQIAAPDMVNGVSQVQPDGKTVPTSFPVRSLDSVANIL